MVDSSLFHPTLVSFLQSPSSFLLNTPLLPHPPTLILSLTPLEAVSQASMASLASPPEPSPFLLHTPSVSLPRPSSSPSLHFPRASRSFKPLHTRPLSGPFRVSAESTSGSGYGLDDLASRLAEKASQAARDVSEKTRKLFETARLKAVEFQERNDLQGKLQQALLAANQKLEELGYDARKKAEKWDRQYRVSQKAQEMADFAAEQVRNADQQFGIVQKVRKATVDLRRNWPTYRRRLDNFLQTPLGRTLSTLAFLWFLLSGWLFRIVFFSIWILPFAAPLLISTAARNAIIEGSCPSCKRLFIGNRSQVVVCNYCRAVVWQPRQDFSKGDSDPGVIDVDIDYN